MNLAKGRCTCLRPNCEHLLAVALQQRKIYQKVSNALVLVLYGVILVEISGREFPSKVQPFNVTKAIRKLRPLPLAGRKLANSYRKHFRHGVSQPGE